MIEDGPRGKDESRRSTEKGRFQKGPEGSREELSKKRGLAEYGGSSR